MRVGIDRLQPSRLHVSIDLRNDDRRMAEKFLYYPEIRPILKHMGSC